MISVDAGDGVFDGGVDDGVIISGCWCWDGVLVKFTGDVGSGLEVFHIFREITNTVILSFHHALGNLFSSLEM